MNQDKAGNSIIIHIGFPKTATTWLQKKFYPNVENYEYYMPWVSNVEIIGVDPMDPTYNMRKWKEKNNIIISNENFLGIGRINGFIRIGLAHRLKEIFPDAHIVIFIRNQIDLIASEYSWYVKNSGCTYSPRQFIHKRIRNPYNTFSYKLFHLNYDVIIDLYKNLFGEQKVHIFLYEELKSKPEAFVEKFSKQLNLKVNLRSINFLPINTRMRIGLFPIIRLINLFTKPKILYRHHILSLPFLGYHIPRIAEMLNKYSIFGPKPNAKTLLGDDLIEELYSFFKESNKALINKHNLSNIRNYNYPL